MKFKSRSLKKLTFRSMAPNIVTILALSSGLTAFKFALAGEYEYAAVCVILAGVLDSLDGGLARMLNSASKFGAELDSLSDVVSFGVVPAMIVYIWTLNSIGGLGWAVTLAFVVCQALRLARFNSKLEVEDEPYKSSGFLTGIPAPVGAAMAILPMVLEFETKTGWFQNPYVVAGYISLVCAGMVSKIPTYSFKQLFIRKAQMIPMLLCVGLLAALIIEYGWVMLGVTAVVYFCFIPLGIIKYSQIKKNLKN